jgi:hypothetical protein
VCKHRRRLKKRGALKKSQPQNLPIAQLNVCKAATASNSLAVAISAADASAIDNKSLSGHEGGIVAGKKGHGHVCNRHNLNWLSIARSLVRCILTPDRMKPTISAFGTKRTFQQCFTMSAFGDKADIERL